MQDSESWREKVARIIDPKAWQASDARNDSRRHPMILQDLDAEKLGPSLRKADAIAALSPAPEGWREAVGYAMFLALYGEEDSAEWATNKEAWFQAGDRFLAVLPLSASPLPVGGGEKS